MALWIFPAPSVIVGARHYMWSGENVLHHRWEALDAACYYALDRALSTRARPSQPRSEPGRVERSSRPPEDDGERGWGQSLGVDALSGASSPQRCSHPGNRKTLSTSSSGWEIYLRTSYVPGCSIALGDRRGVCMLIFSSRMQRGVESIVAMSSRLHILLDDRDAADSLWAGSPVSRCVFSPRQR